LHLPAGAARREMKIDAKFFAERIGDAPTLVQTYRELGYDGLFATETRHDPFLPLMLAAEHGQGLDLSTRVALAFSRSPMHLAYLGHDLQAYTEGRFTLGLGSQVQAHIVHRFGATWSQPISRMREAIQAIRAIWRSWDDGTSLNFRGELYQHTLMTPFFSPRPNPYGQAPIFLAAVGPRMTELAGEVADGLVIHDFSTERYIRTVTMPALQRGLEKAGRGRADVQVVCPGVVVTGSTEKDYLDVLSRTRSRIAFHASTAAYRRVLDVHGWGDLYAQLNVLSHQRKWSEMARLISDDILETFAVVGPPEEIAAKLLSRYGDLADRISLDLPGVSREQAADLLRGLKSPVAELG